MDSVVQETNKRIITFDLVRGFAILFMFLIHIFRIYAHPNLQSSFWGEISQFLGGPLAAPVFMMIMGFFYGVKLKPNNLNGYKRGVLLFIGGYLLNLFRFGIPLMIIGEKIELGENLFSYILLEDILQLAGLSFIFLGFFLGWNLLNILFVFQVLFQPIPLFKAPLSLEPLNAYPLTQREKEIVPLLLKGLSNKEIAFSLSISQKTVKNHIYNLYQKTGLRSRMELVNMLYNKE
jgi:DNA-binding CsgD family transcriptional regulator